MNFSPKRRQSNYQHSNIKKNGEKAREIANAIPLKERENYDDGNSFLVSLKFTNKNGAYKYSDKVIEKAENGSFHELNLSDLKPIPSNDLLFAQEKAVKILVENKQKEALKKSKNDKNYDYFVFVDSKTKEVGIGRNPKETSLGGHVVEATVGGALKFSINLSEAIADLKRGENKKAGVNTLKGISNLGEVATVGIGNYLGEKYSNISAGEVYYGSLGEIQKRKNELKSAIKSRVDILTSIAVSNALAKNVPVENIPLEFNVSDVLGNSKTLMTSAGQVTAKAMEKITVVVNVPSKELATATVTTGVGVNLISGGSSGDSNLEYVNSNEINKSSLNDINDYKTKGSDSNKRYTPKESEIELKERLEEMYKDNPDIKVETQQSFKGRSENIRYGEAGSVRLDNSLHIVSEKGAVKETFEMKNYIAKNHSNMTSTIGKQAIKGAKELPEGTVQNIVIDIRGQMNSFDTNFKDRIIKDIVRKSDGIILKENIFFMD